MAKIRRVAIGEKAWKDARGWVLNPLALAGLEGKPLGNLHVASMQPGAVRGNHVHGLAAEWHSKQSMRTAAYSWQLEQKPSLPSTLPVFAAAWHSTQPFRLKRVVRTPSRIVRSR